MDNNKKRRRNKLALGLSVVIGVFVLGSLPPAATNFPWTHDFNAINEVAAAQLNHEQLSVTLDQSRVVQLRTPVARVSVANPEIADIMVLEPDQLYLVGKRLGSTNVVLWDESEELQGSIGLEVTPDLEQLKRRLHQVLPNERVQVRSAHGSIVLSGQVSSAEKAAAAVTVAEGFAKGAGNGGSVLNLVEVGGSQQVLLEVQVAEMSRDFIRKMDFGFDALFDDGRTSINLFSTPVDSLTDTGFLDFGFLGSAANGYFLFDAILDIAKNEGLAKILAEPNLTTLSGQRAEFLAGGEFPIPVAQSNERTTIEWKEYGVGLKFVPYVLESDVISLKLNISVSELSSENDLRLSTGTNDVFVVPSITKRDASSTLELKSGETIAIAGLIKEEVREAMSKFPGLGDIPVLGNLFKSQEYVKGQTELIIFVTPRLAYSYSPDVVKLPTDRFVEPSDQEFYLLGRLEALPKSEASDSGVGRLGPDKRGTEGVFGHDL